MNLANAPFPKQTRIVSNPFAAKHLVKLAILSASLLSPAFGGEASIGTPSSKAVLQISAQVISVLPSPSAPTTTQAASRDAIQYEFSTPLPLEVDRTILVIPMHEQSLSRATSNESAVLKCTTIVAR